MWFDPYPYRFVAPAADAETLRSSIDGYFSYNRPGATYIIEYDDLYHTTIDLLREDGWLITLEADSGGELFYAVHGHSVSAD